jgi:thioredoxin-like negative regulator of GroEL
MPQASNKRLTCLCSLLFVLFLSACTQDADQLLASARDREAKGDLTGAIIDLKSALQVKADDGPLRFYLGRLYNETFDSVSAEKELRRAMELGTTEGGRVAVEMARALRAQGRHKDVLEQAKPSDVYEAEPLATLYALRGRSQYTLRQLPAAKESLALAEKTHQGVPEARLLAASIEVTEGRPERV